MNVTRKASLRTSSLDYAKRKVKAPTLAPVMPAKAALPQQRDYAKFTPMKLGVFQGTEALTMMGKPRRVKF